jgi:hypothetical protein
MRATSYSTASFGGLPRCFCIVLLGGVGNFRGDREIERLLNKDTRALHRAKPAGEPAAPSAKRARDKADNSQCRQVNSDNGTFICGHVDAGGVAKPFARVDVGECGSSKSAARLRRGYVGLLSQCLPILTKFAGQHMKVKEKEQSPGETRCDHQEYRHSFGK